MTWSKSSVWDDRPGLGSILQDLGDTSFAVQLTQSALDLSLVTAAAAPHFFGFISRADADVPDLSHTKFMWRNWRGDGKSATGSSWDLETKIAPGTPGILRYKRHVEVRTYTSTFRMTNLAYVFSKHTLVNVLMKVRSWLGLVAEAEDKAWEQGVDPVYPPFPDLSNEITQGLYGGVRDLCVITTRRLYERLSMAQLQPRFAWKLLKDYRGSIKRKALRHPDMSLAPRLLKYSRTACRSLSLFLAADFTISVAELSFNLWFNPRPKRRKLRFWAVGVACHAARCTITLVADGVGAAIGGSIRSELGPYAGYLLFDLASSVALDSVVFNPILNYERELLWKAEDEDQVAPGRLS